MQSVTLCACVRNERRYLIEWIAYHALLGFKPIVIYDNESRDGTADVLRALHDREIVEYRRMPDQAPPGAQVAAYRDAVMRCTTEWLMPLDLDEFVVLHQHETVPEFLAGFGPDVSEVCLNWRVFGSSGRSRGGFGPVVRRFQSASLGDFPKNRHVKSIARAALVEEPEVHSFVMKEGRVVHDDGSDAAVPDHVLSDRISHGVASVHHYILKSRREYRAKAARGQLSPRGEGDRFRKYTGDFWRFYDRNDTPNHDALRHYSSLRREMLRLRYYVWSALWRR